MTEEAQLRDWVSRYLPAGVSSNGAPGLTPINGDAGFRLYFRLDSEPTLIAVHAPPARENNPAFVRKGLALARAGVHVPRIWAVDFQQGFMLLEDLGDDLFLPLLGDDNVDELYGKALDTLRTLQRTEPDPALFPPYDAELLEGEMALFPRWFVEDLLGVVLAVEERALLDDLFARLVTAALEQPRVVVHRDYHSRNLLRLADGGVGVVDFQDGVIGPVTYDLLSLLKDCYIRWPRSAVSAWALDFLRSLDRPDIDDDQWQLWFDWMGLQRHIKVLGIFARLYRRDGKDRYLSDLPLVIRYTLEVASRYPDFHTFYQWFGDRLLPIIERQPWYRPWQTAGETSCAQ